MKIHFTGKMINEVMGNKFLAKELNSHDILSLRLRIKDEVKPLLNKWIEVGLKAEDFGFVVTTGSESVRIRRWDVKGEWGPQRYSPLKSFLKDIQQVK